MRRSEPRTTKTVLKRGAEGKRPGRLDPENASGGITAAPTRCASQPSGILSYRAEPQFMPGTCPRILAYRAIIILMTGFVELEAIRRDEEFVLYRGEHSDLPGSPSVLILAPASIRPRLGSIKKIEHEYSLRGELDSSWAARPLALSDQHGQRTLVLEDPGGETLERF